MQQLDLRRTVEEKAPGYLNRYPRFLQNLGLGFLTRLLRIKRLNTYLANNSEKTGIDLVRAFFEENNISCVLSESDRNRIPAEGPMIAVSNHPLGGLDGLALLLAVSQVRPDVKIVVNDILMKIEGMRELFLPYDVYSNKMQKREIMDIRKAVQNEEAVIFFPSGVVSRLSRKGVYDKPWKRGALQFAQKMGVPILPMFVKAHNSMLFYFTALFSSMLSMLMLPREIFHKSNKSIVIRVGDPIHPDAFRNLHLNLDEQTVLLKKHVYRIGHRRRGIYKTYKTIIHPTDPALVKAELEKSRLLSEEAGGKKIYLVEYHTAPNVMREIGRLRELTFRQVGEGTWSPQDTDRFDRDYKHIVVFNEEDNDIMGSYRIGVCSEILAQQGDGNMYVDTMFEVTSEFVEMQKDAIEMGRSFVCAKYWRSRALDYLWKGIGTFLSENPEIRWMYGTVSISDHYSLFAQSLIVRYYQKWYEGKLGMAFAKKRYIITHQHRQEVDQILTGEDHQADFKILKQTLKNLGYTLPILYKRYTEMCEYGGVTFIEWSLDEAFNNAVDGLVVVDTTQIRDAMRKRYFPNS